MANITLYNDQPASATFVPNIFIDEYMTQANGEYVKIYLDESLKRFDIVYPACGSGNSAIPLTCEELAQYSACQGWVDVCKDWDR